ncbi:hypothetical protein PPERSA_00492 [Pseudocohnilembus persalinus]|uniref:Uncharacterized protein n=1 Tax=Pseudocohnilembus persalinus TaxID=266149 RepID=A0A0V0QI47_PSEPJ|nr:hypothetical protein PPERSA_00492 [Pseudocohnilembus persalinus]|eukprot:KRX01870.1 hypothetical protein PPERSA_00492 [Pseudocohnilembus persalinus]
MGNEQGKGSQKNKHKISLTKQNIELLLVKLKGHLELIRDKRTGQLQKKVKELSCMMLANQRDREQEVYKMVSLQEDEQFVAGVNILLRYIHILQDRSLLIEQSRGDAQKLQELLPYLLSIAWAQKHITHDSLQEYNQKFSMMLGADIYQVAIDSPDKIDKDLIRYFRLNTTYNEDLYDTMQKFSQVTGISMEQINMAGHNIGPKIQQPVQEYQPAQNMNFPQQYQQQQINTNINPNQQQQQYQLNNPMQSNYSQPQQQNQQNQYYGNQQQQQPQQQQQQQQQYQNSDNYSYPEQSLVREDQQQNQVQHNFSNNNQNQNLQNLNNNQQNIQYDNNQQYQQQAQQNQLQDNFQNQIQNTNQEQIQQPQQQENNNQELQQNTSIQNNEQQQNIANTNNDQNINQQEEQKNNNNYPTLQDQQLGETQLYKNVQGTKGNFTPSQQQQDEDDMFAQLQKLKEQSFQ